MNHFQCPLQSSKNKVRNKWVWVSQGGHSSCVLIQTMGLFLVCHDQLAVVVSKQTQNTGQSSALSQHRSLWQKNLATFCPFVERRTLNPSCGQSLLQWPPKDCSSLCYSRVLNFHVVVIMFLERSRDSSTQTSGHHSRCTHPLLGIKLAQDLEQSNSMKVTWLFLLHL